MPLGDVPAVVGRAIEQDHNLRDPTAHAREAAREVVRLVAGNNDDRQGEGFSQG